jgi:hypothetical protein
MFMEKTSRRKFLQVAAIAPALPLAAAVSSDKKKKGMKNVFVHHVYFWLKNPGSATDRAKLVEGLTMLTEIPVLKKWHIGVPADTHREVVDRSYAISWLTIFKDKAAEEVYQVHPVHQKFVEEYAHLWNKVVVYDSVDV